MLLLESALRGYLKGNIPSLDGLPEVRSGKPVFVHERVRLKFRDGRAEKIVYVLGSLTRFRSYKKAGIEVTEPDRTFAYLEDPRNIQDADYDLQVKIADPANIVRYELIETYPENTVLFSNTQNLPWSVSPTKPLEIRLHELESE